VAPVDDPIRDQFGIRHDERDVVARLDRGGSAFLSAWAYGRDLDLVREASSRWRGPPDCGFFMWRALCGFIMPIST
jgi:hypothetical protein